MRDLVINNSLNLIKKNFPEYNEEKIEEIEYGLVGLYMMITKSIVIFLLAYFLGIFVELLIFTVIYNIIRMPSFGMHANSSLQCLIMSTSIFIGSAFLSTIIVIPIIIKIILGILCTLYIFKYSPADTEKRPIINPKRRLTYKIISTSIAVAFALLSISFPDNFLQNCFIFSLIIQCIMVSPITYKIFNQPYDNYKTYNN